MTAQIQDTLTFCSTEYVLAGISTGELFTPSVFDLKPSMASTACWRGYHANYEVFENSLFLKSLHVNLIEGERGAYRKVVGPVIQGVTPTPAERKFDFFNNHYNDIKYPIPYSGGLLIAKGFIRNLYVHMGFHPAWKYEIVLELIFENGSLVSSIDRTEKMVELRKQIDNLSKGNTNFEKPSKEEIQLFVERAFDRSYSL